MSDLDESTLKLRLRKPSMVPFKKILNADANWQPLTNKEKINKYQNNFNFAFSTQEDEDIPLIENNTNKCDVKSDINLNEEIPEIKIKTKYTIPESDETSFSFLLQIFLPYLIAGFGTVGAGMVLDVVQHWPVFIEVRELFILVPSLLGLKGNLEMTLASRLSTQANLISSNERNQVIEINGTTSLQSCHKNLPLKKLETDLTTRKIKYDKLQNCLPSTNSLHLTDDISSIHDDENDKDEQSLKQINPNHQASSSSKLSSLTKKDSQRINAWPSLIGGNLSLIQGQASIIGFLAAFTAVIMGWIPEGHFDVYNSKILCASSILTASLASAILGIIMVLVVTLSRKCHLNPDNIATPIAASLGDLITLSLLGFISRHISNSMPTSPGISYYVVLVYAILTPIWLYLCYRNPYTRDVVQTGWSPIVFAMLISSIGGFILDFTVHRFRGIAVFQPVINGVGGNLAAIQASRLSTQLHQSKNIVNSPQQIINTNQPYPNPQPTSSTSSSELAFINMKSSRQLTETSNLVTTKRKSIWKTFFGSDLNARTTRILLALVVPGHLVFIYTISYMKAGHTTITFHFAWVYLLAAVLQVTILLYFTEWIVHYMWSKNIDPDNAAIPYITAVGDLLGTTLLALAFWILWNIGDKDSDVGD